MNRRALLVSDVHLSVEKGDSTALALAALLRENPDVDVVLNGDIFDLSLYSCDRPLGEWLSAIFAAHPDLTTELRKHLARGRTISFVAGNHDAWLTEPSGKETLAKILGNEFSPQIEIVHWFLRIGSVHIEHGHLYDRDNSFPHPLGGFDPLTEPLGTALMRRFVAPNQAYFYAHAHRTTPIGGLVLALKRWKFRAPIVILNYFLAATGLVFDALVRKSRVKRQIEVGSREALRLAPTLGMKPEVLEALANEVVVSPRNESARATFMRLYFDRVIATVFTTLGLATLGGAFSLTLLGKPSLDSRSILLVSVVTALSIAYLWFEVNRRKNRYGANIVEEITARAELVRSLVSARTVVFGHTHVPMKKDGYVNLGSFGYGYPKRSFAWLDEDGSVELAELTRS